MCNTLQVWLFKHAHIQKHRKGMFTGFRKTMMSLWCLGMTPQGNVILYVQL
jgi:hypothetical protein